MAELPKFERPKTLFGKMPYAKEQFHIGLAIDFIMRGTAFSFPELIEGLGPVWVFYRRLPIEFRRKRARGWFVKAKTQLEEVGV